MKITNSISKFCILKSVMNVKVFWESWMAQQEKFNFHYTFQGTKFANGICNFHSIFYTLSALENPSMHPVRVTRHSSRFRPRM